VPGGGRAPARGGRAPARVEPIAETAASRRNVGSPADTPRTAARMAPARKAGEVIDLAVRRSTKRAGTRPAKGRNRGSGVATLHQLRRKNTGRTHNERQLA